MYKHVKLFSICVVMLLGMAGATRSYAQTTNYQVYSLFVMNIAKYSVWPAAGTEFTIKVLGKSKIYDELVKSSAGKNIGGLVIKVTQIETAADIGQAHMIFVPDGKSSLLDEVVKSTNGKPVLIITEREGLYKKGAGFSFVLTENNTLRFDINNTELEKRQIKVSKSLTSLANSMM